MTRFVDWGRGAVDLHAVKAAGFVGICRYLSWTPEKNITTTEAALARHLGLDCLLVWETTADRSTQGSDAGKQDGIAAARMAHTVGYPAGATIYAACDTDTTWTSVSPYQGSFNAAVYQHGYRGDIYAGYNVVKGAVDAGFSVEPWQTSAWSAGQIHPAAVLYQDQYHVPISGIDCDSSQVLGKVPGWAANDGTAPPNDSSQEDDMRVIYVPNDNTRAKALLKGDGTLGAATTAEGAQAYLDAGIPLEPVTAATYDFLKSQS